MVYGLSRAYGGALPGVGGLFDQDVALLRLHAVLALAGHFEGQEAPLDESRIADPLAGLEMMAL